jgi:DNA-binding NarL/FixJ family response regulator
LEQNTSINVAIADDQPIFRKGLISLLQPYPHLTVSLEAESGKTLLDQLSRMKTDVVLLDMKMPDMNGIDVCKKIKEQYPHTKVIALSAYDHHYYVSNFFEAGGDGYILKDVEIGEIVYAINYVHQNGSYLSEQTSLPLIKKLMDMDHHSVDYTSTLSIPLKAYELEILKLIASEYTTTEIATKMELSPKTIENYRGIMMEKIGAKNIAGLVTYAIRKGLIEL